MDKVMKGADIVVAGAPRAFSSAPILCFVFEFLSKL